MYVIILRRSITKQQDNYLTIESRTSEHFARMCCTCKSTTSERVGLNEKKTNQ